MLIRDACAFAWSLSLSLPIAFGSPQDAAPATSDELMTRLETMRLDYDYDDMKLAAVIDDLRDRLDMNIHVSWRSMEAANVRPADRVTITLKDTTPRAFLDLLLRELQHDFTQLSYDTSSGVLVLQSDALGRPPTVRGYYDVTDLLESGYAMRRFLNTPVLGLKTTGRELLGVEDRQDVGGGGFGGGGGGGYGGGGGGLFGDAGDEANRPSAFERVRQVADLITELIEPDSWQINGGDTGALRVINSTLIIDHTENGHRAIATLLEQLRASAPMPVDVDAVLVRIERKRAQSWRRDCATFPRLDDEDFDRCVEDGTIVMQATTSGFVGRGILVSALTQRELLGDFEPVVGEGVSGFAPHTATFTQGLELIVLPMAAQGAPDLVLDVQMAWIPETRSTERAVALGAAVSATIDQATQTMRTVSATTRVHWGQALALSVPDTDLGDRQTEEWLIVRTRAARLAD